MKVFLAGATGVIGRSLIPMLKEAGHTVVGTTRSEKGRAALGEAGVDGAIVDVFDAAALEKAVVASSPDIIIHQLTDLASGIDPAAPEEGVRRNARLRREGTANLVRAARAASVVRVVAQSIGWAYAPKDGPFIETDPLDTGATGTRAITVSEGVIPLETAVLAHSELEGIVLRYGQLYGPGTWSSEPNGTAPLHVDAAAYAAFLAIGHGAAGAYNVANPGGALDVEKIVREMGWRADFRLPNHV
jgi:nucleoside-diphosphate-sugar epimerase